MTFLARVRLGRLSVFKLLGEHKIGVIYMYAGVSIESSAYIQNLAKKSAPKGGVEAQNFYALVY